MLAGCGAEDRAGQLADDAEKRAERLAGDARRELREESDKVRAEVRRLRERVEELLGRLEQAVPRAQRTSPDVERRAGGTVEAFLTDVLRNVDAYWVRTFAASDLPEPRVGYAWVPPGRLLRTGCGTPADDNAAFFCPADDTIYIAQRFAAALEEGVLRGLPGERSGGARARRLRGGVHRRARVRPQPPARARPVLARAVEQLQAVRAAGGLHGGTWGSSVFAAGKLKPGDVEEALGTALAVGDFDVSDANHHGTPEERRTAWLTGFESADPSACARYVPAT
jgi:predicted metalloprotease